MMSIDCMQKQVACPRGLGQVESPHAFMSRTRATALGGPFCPLPPAAWRRRPTFWVSRLNTRRPHHPPRPPRIRLRPSTSIKQRCSPTARARVSPTPNGAAGHTTTRPTCYAYTRLQHIPRRHEVSHEPVNTHRRKGLLSCPHSKPIPAHGLLHTSSPHCDHPRPYMDPHGPLCAHSERLR